MPEEEIEKCEETMLYHFNELNNVFIELIAQSEDHYPGLNIKLIVDRIYDQMVQEADLAPPTELNEDIKDGPSEDAEKYDKHQVCEDKCDQHEYDDHVDENVDGIDDNDYMLKKLQE